MRWDHQIEQTMDQRMMRVLLVLVLVSMPAVQATSYVVEPEVFSFISFAFECCAQVDLSAQELYWPVDDLCYYPDALPVANSTNQSVVIDDAFYCWPEYYASLAADQGYGSVLMIDPWSGDGDLEYYALSYWEVREDRVPVYYTNDVSVREGSVVDYAPQPIRKWVFYTVSLIPAVVIIPVSAFKAFRAVLLLREHVPFYGTLTTSMVIMFLEFCQSGIAIAYIIDWIQVFKVITQDQSYTLYIWNIGMMELTTIIALFFQLNLLNKFFHPVTILVFKGLALSVFAVASYFYITYWLITEDHTFTNSTGSLLWITTEFGAQLVIGSLFIYTRRMIVNTLKSIENTEDAHVDRISRLMSYSAVAMFVFVIEDFFLFIYFLEQWYISSLAYYLTFSTGLLISTCLIGFFQIMALPRISSEKRALKSGKFTSKNPRRTTEAKQSREGGEQ